MPTNYIFTGEKFDALRKQVQTESNYFYINPKQIEKPFLTIVTACYNREKTIIDSLNSTISQNGGDLQIIAIDDGSSDSSVELLKSMQEKLSLLIISPLNIGFSASLNNALCFARGDYFKTLDSDDYHVPGSIKTITNYLKSNLDTELLCGNAYILDPVTNKYATKFINVEINDLNKYFKEYDHPFLRVAHGAIVSKKELLAKAGLYNPKNDHCGDAELSYHLMKYSKKSTYINEPIIAITLGGMSYDGSIKGKCSYRTFLIKYSKYKYLSYAFRMAKQFLHDKTVKIKAIKAIYRMTLKKFRKKKINSY